MTNTLNEDFYEEEPVILESEVKDLKILERNKSPGRWDTNRITSSHRDMICQNPNRNMSTNMENKIMAYILETLTTHPNLQKKRRCQGV